VCFAFKILSVTLFAFSYRRDAVSKGGSDFFSHHISTARGCPEMILAKLKRHVAQRAKI